MTSLVSAAPQTGGARRRMPLERRQSLVGLAFVLPAVIFFALFNFYPMAHALYLSFTDWDLLTPAEWVGFGNYAALFSDPTFLESLAITLRYTLESAIPLVLLSLGLALLLNQRFRLSGAFQVVYFVPVVMPAVVSAIIWGLLFRPSAPVNNALGMFGVAPIPWLASADWALHALVIVSVWGSFGYNTLILLAGLQSIPPDFGEAASIDGASRWRITRDITLPLLAPRLLFVTATTVAALLTSFVLPYVMTNGGPGTATRVLPLLIYQSGFQFLHAGQASAMAFILLLITLVFTALQFRLFGQEVQ
ncbi:MAG: sugar ABC transporter permease [Thermomicrobiales bacterium]|nr:sugar ABC transporter permease [Thermomicrobiales bacterium]